MKKIRYPCYIIVSRQECKYYYTTSSQTVGGLKMTECVTFRVSAGDFFQLVM